MFCWFDVSQLQFILSNLNFDFNSHRGYQGKPRHSFKGLLCVIFVSGSESGGHHHHQPMSSTLPHPDRLTRSCGLGLTGHRQGLDTATDITQAVSACLDFTMPVRPMHCLPVAPYYVWLVTVCAVLCFRQW